jgi:hypothetical protein
MKILFQLLISFIAFSLVVSCSKDEVETLSQDNLELVVAKSEADFMTESDMSLGNELSVRNGVFSNSQPANPIASNMPSCAVVTVLEGGLTGSTFVFPFKVEIDFGNGCTNANGTTRKGKITVEFSNFLMINGSTMTIVRGDDYFINLRKIEGTITYTNITTNIATPSWTRVVTNGKVTRPNGQVFTHTGNRTVVLAVGANTPALNDNIHHITAGNHSVTKPNGTTLNATIQQTLIKPYACQHIVSGQLNLQGGVLNGVLDYGDGTCDNQATYTHVNGSVYNISL